MADDIGQPEDPELAAEDPALTAEAQQGIFLALDGPEEGARVAAEEAERVGAAGEFYGRRPLLDAPARAVVQVDPAITPHETVEHAGPDTTSPDAPVRSS